MSNSKKSVNKIAPMNLEQKTRLSRHGILEAILWFSRSRSSSYLQRNVLASSLRNGNLLDVNFLHFIGKQREPKNGFFIASPASSSLFFFL
jgi:hypothetical protein